MTTVFHKNHYELLGVSPDASNDEIQIAFRDMSRIYSPDSEFFADIIDDPPRPEHVALLKLITAAYETLIDPDLRKIYDRERGGI